jgi:hypothetical protein
MAQATQNKLFILLLSYSIVLLHAIVPHCHAADAHAMFQTEKTSTHTCDSHHHHDDASEQTSHEHQVCQSDDLHGQYLKAEASSIDFDALLAEVVDVWLYIIHDSKENTTYSSVPSDAIVRCCILDSNIHRGPPA